MNGVILSKINQYNNELSQEKARKALEFFAEKVDYPGAEAFVARILDILIPFKPDESTILATVLYEVFDRDLISEEQVIKHFGKGTFQVLDGMKRLNNLSYGENNKIQQTEALRKMFIGLANDLRVILLWLAYRLSKMEILDSIFDGEMALHYAKETMNVCVPIASRLGIYRLKTQLEDQAFKYLNPVEYHRIINEIQKEDMLKKDSMQLIKKKLQAFFDKHGLEVKIYGRIKSAYSIYTKLKKKGSESINDLYDLFAIRVIFPDAKNTDDLYNILGLIHTEWKPLSNRFKDYIAVPKSNGYRSLHTVVLGLSPKNPTQPVEVQIRDQKMHREAEYGIASHWLYKQKGTSNFGNIDSHAEWIKGLERIHEIFESEFDVIKEVAIDLFKDRIFVLTPKGEVKDLPLGSIPVDFAYAVHTDVGNKCIGAKVNGATVPLDYSLRNGEVVEILTRRDAVPKLKWLYIVKTSFAKTKIKLWFSSQNKKIREPMRGDGLDVVKRFRPSNEVYSAARPDKKKFLKNQVGSLPLEDQITVVGEDNMVLKISSCCAPKYGDEISAYVTSNGKISIHQLGCKVLKRLNEERFLVADWKKL
ncbi:MAG: TGS domain-containing protein [Patescibacteria group bacterium]